MENWQSEPAAVRAAVGAKPTDVVEAIAPPEPATELVERSMRMEVRYRGPKGLQTGTVTVRAMNRAARLAAGATAARLASMAGTSLAVLDIDAQTDCLNFGVAWHGIVELADSDGKPDDSIEWIVAALNDDVTFAAVLAGEVQRHTDRYWFRAAKAGGEDQAGPTVEMVPVGAPGAKR